MKRHPSGHRFCPVADPDELLKEPGVIEGIRNQGFEIFPFNDPVPFRYAHERRFRRIWDTGAATNLVVVLRASRSDLNVLPSDLLEKAKRDRRLLSFSHILMKTGLSSDRESLGERGPGRRGA